MLALAAWPAAAEDVRVGGTGGALATVRLLADTYARQHSGIHFQVLPSLGSGGGIKAVLAGAVELAVSSRPLKAEETRQGAHQIVLGRTPFVFVTFAANPVDRLTVDELVDIYAGKTEFWPDGQRIRIVLRPIGDADSEAVKHISEAMRAAKSVAEQRKGMPFAVSDQDAADAMEKIPGALGVSTLAQLLTERRRLKVLHFNGIEPTARNLESGSYPLSRTFYFVLGPRTSPPVQSFLAFVASPAGQALLRRYGYTVR